MTKAYKIILSSGGEIRIDQDELNSAMVAVNTGSMGKMRQGIFNPSFLVAIILDEERVSGLERAISEAEGHKRLFPDKEVPIPKGLKSLENIFNNIKKLK